MEITEIRRKKRIIENIVIKFRFAKSDQTETEPHIWYCYLWIINFSDYQSSTIKKGSKVVFSDLLWH